jgi:hypothetical protein
MTSEGLVEALVERVHEVVARSESIGARSLVLIDASRHVRRDETHVPRCAWCGRIALGGCWLERADVPTFVRRAISERSTDGICPTCFASQLGSPTNEVCVHARNKRTADFLAAELRDYGVRQGSDHVLAVEVTRRDQHFLPALLTRLADCLEANALDPVQVRIGTHAYVLSGR